MTRPLKYSVPHKSFIESFAYELEKHAGWEDIDKDDRAILLGKYNDVMPDVFQEHLVESRYYGDVVNALLRFISKFPEMRLSGLSEKDQDLLDDLFYTTFHVFDGMGSFIEEQEIDNARVVSDLFVDRMEKSDYSHPGYLSKTDILGSGEVM